MRQNKKTTIKKPIKASNKQEKRKQTIKASRIEHKSNRSKITDKTTRQNHHYYLPKRGRQTGTLERMWYVSAARRRESRESLTSSTSDGHEGTESLRLETRERESVRLREKT